MRGVYPTALGLQFSRKPGQNRGCGHLLEATLPCAIYHEQSAFMIDDQTIFSSSSYARTYLRRGSPSMLCVCRHAKEAELFDCIRLDRHVADLGMLLAERGVEAVDGLFDLRHGEALAEFEV